MLQRPWQRRVPGGEAEASRFVDIAVSAVCRDRRMPQLRDCAGALPTVAEHGLGLGKVWSIVCKRMDFRFSGVPICHPRLCQRSSAGGP